MASLRIVELGFHDYAAARDWFCTNFNLSIEFESPAEHYALLDAGGVKLAIKGNGSNAPTDAPIAPATLLQWEVADVEAWQQTTQVACLKPLQISPEGYRRLVIAGPEGLPLMIYDWKG